MASKFGTVLLLVTLAVAVSAGVNGVPDSGLRHSARFGEHSPPPPRTNPSPPFERNVMDFGADNTGKADNTEAFQKALDAVSADGGGVVKVPAGHYGFKGTISIPSYVTLQGTYTTVPSNSWQAGEKPLAGSVLMPTAGRGDEGSAPFCTVNRDATLTGFVIYYPEQKVDQPPAAYPYTAFLVGDNAAVTDCEFLNSYNAVSAVNSARHYIARIQGQPANVGVFVDQTYDIGRIEDVHFNPWFSLNHAYTAHQYTHGRAFVFARSDWEYVFNTFAFGYAVGYHFIESKDGALNGNFVGIGMDMAVNASVLVDASQPMGILITNGEFTSFLNPDFGHSESNSTQVVVSKSNTGSIRFSNTAFWGPAYQVLRNEGEGTVAFSDCNFVNWDDGSGQRPGNTGAAALESSAGSLIVKGCEFFEDKNQIKLSKGVRKAVIVGNMIKGKERFDVEDSSSVNLQSGLNASD